MFHSLLLSSLLAGCATADRVQELEEKLTTIEKEVAELKKRPASSGKSGKDQINPEQEKKAQAMWKEVQGLLDQGKTDDAKAKLTEMGKKYSSTRTYRRAQKMKAEIDVIGKAAPANLDGVEWYNTDSGKKVDLTSGTTMLVFWEIWCPHCKREVPNLQQTYNDLKDKGLEMVGLTKITRSSTPEKVKDFIKEKNVTYPMAKEDGKLSQHFNVSGIPAAAVVKDGKVVWRGHPARLKKEQIQAWLN